MKKIFTLIAVVMMAITANAKETLGLPSPWNDSCVLTGSTYSFSGSWAGAGLWLGTDDGWTDASAYDYVAVIYTDHTGGDVKIAADYNKAEREESWGTVYASSSALIDMPSGYAAFALDKKNTTDNGKLCAEEIRQITLQDQGSAASVTITEICLLTTAEYEDLKNGSPLGPKVKEFALPGEAGVVAMTEGEQNAGWYASSWIGMENLADQGYKTFVVEIASATAGFQLLAQNWSSGEQVVKRSEPVTEPAVIAYTIGEGAELQGLGQFALQNMNITDSWMDPTSGEMVSWYDANNVVVTRAYLTSEEVASNYPEYQDPDAILNIKADAENGVMYNVAGQRVAKANGLVIMNGKKMFVK